LATGPGGFSQWNSGRGGAFPIPDSNAKRRTEATGPGQAHAVDAGRQRKLLIENEKASEVVFRIPVPLPLARYSFAKNRGEGSTLILFIMPGMPGHPSCERWNLSSARRFANTLSRASLRAGWMATSVGGHDRNKQ
jgi:hypothetical protein